MIEIKNYKESFDDFVKDYKAAALDDILEVFEDTDANEEDLVNVIRSHLRALQTLGDVEIKEKIRKDWEMNKGMDW